MDEETEDTSQNEERRDETGHSPEKSGQDSPAPVTFAEFQSVDFEGRLQSQQTVDPRALWSLFSKLAQEADASKDVAARRVYSLLSQLCGIHSRPNDRAEPWGPMMSTGDRRTAIPLDFMGEQSETLLAIAEDVKNPGLRARLADIVWSNDRKTVRGAAIALEAYLDCVNGLIEGNFKPYLQENRASFELQGYLARAVVIARAITKKDPKGHVELPERLNKSILALCKVSKREKQFVVFQEAIELALSCNLIDRATAAKECEELAEVRDEQFLMPIKSLWSFAASLHRALSDKGSEQRCRFNALQQTLAMRKQVHSAAAEAHWVQRALLELRHIDGQDELEESLFLELRRLQRSSTREMASFSLPMDLKELHEEIDEVFGNLDLADAMRVFGLLARSVPIKELRQEALENLRKHPLQAIMGVSHIDHEGKPIAHSPTAELSREQSEEWYRAQALRSEDIRRHLTVAGKIEPARLIVQSRFQIEERHLEPIVSRSPFVPPSQQGIIILGLTRFFQGDFISAAHLLISQLEPCLRHLLKLNGHDPVRLFDDGTEEDFDLNAMFSQMRPALEQIFGTDLLFEIDLLFVGRPGPSLRNDLAHGHVATGSCFHPNVLYGCWLMYCLCMLPLVPAWKELGQELQSLT